MIETEPKVAVEGTRTESSQSFWRTPGFVHSVLLLIIMALIAPLLLKALPAPPPSIAEIAPQALEQIREAPAEQATGAGGSEGLGAGAGEGTDGGGAGLGATRQQGRTVPTRFRCVGDPPRQIEDPQSPPCIPFWEGDNGGATYQGVTKDTITIAAPEFGKDDPAMKAYEAFFNSRFQFYGRKLKILGVQQDQRFDTDEATAQRHLAQKVDEEYRAFGSLNFLSFEGTVYFRELARRHVVGSLTWPEFDQKTLQSMEPYVWQYGMAIDHILSMTGEWMCRRLAGRMADHTTDPALIGDRRTFGLIWSTTKANLYDIRPVTQELEGCGSPFAVVEHMGSHENYEGNEHALDVVLKMKTAGVTSILGFCSTGCFQVVQNIASAQSYYPEWLVATHLFHEFLVSQKQQSSGAHRKSMFGVSYFPRLIRAADDPSIWALQEADPNAFQPSQTGADGSGNRQVRLHTNYRSLLLMASGIQMAGPNLTPETFALGLQNTAFPNPDHPIQAGKVSFLGGRFGMTIDAAEMWWGENAPAPYTAEPPGTWCYIDGGSRRRPGFWPGDPRFFEGTCDSGR